MAIAVQMDYTVDLCKPAHLIQMDVPFFTGDKNAHRFHVKLMRNGCAIDVSGMSASGYMVRADKQTVVWDGEVDGCDIYLTMPASCYTVPGRFRLLLRVALDDTIETALWVEGSMRESTTDVIVDPGNVLPSLEELLAQIAAMEAATGEAVRIIDNAKSEMAEHVATMRKDINTAISDAKSDVEQAVAAVNTNTAGAIASANAAATEANAAATEAYAAKDAIQGDLAALTQEILLQAPAIVETATGGIVSITDGAARPAVSLISHIEPVQEGEGDTSPDNVRPISGWDKVTAQRTGKNLFDKSAVTHNAYVDGSTGDLSYGAASYTASDWMPVTADAGHVYVTSPLTGEQCGAFYDAMRKYVSGFTDYNRAIPIPDDAKYIRITVADSVVDTLQVELGSTATAYEPYRGSAISAVLPETVYGGTMDWNTGVLTVTHKTIVINGASTINTWPTNTGNNVVPASLYSKLISISRETVICDKLPSITGATNANNIYSYFNTIYFEIEKSLLSTHDMNGIRAFVAENPLQCVVKLATPYTIQLTPQQLSTLKDTNNVWSDTGNTDLSYVADTKMYIDKKIAAIAAATV